MFHDTSNDEFVKQVRKLSHTFIPYNVGPTAPPSRLKRLADFILSPLHAIPGWVVFLLTGLLCIVFTQILIEREFSYHLSYMIDHLFDRLVRG